MFELNRNQEESFIDYCERLIDAKDVNLIDIDKSEIWELLFNEKVSSDHARKCLVAVKKLVNKIKTEGYESISEEDILKQIELKRIEFEKEKMRFYDQRTAYNKDIRNEARFDELKDIVKNVASSLDLYKKSNDFQVESSDNDLLVGLNDLHFGIEIHNYWNNYNSDIAKVRLEKYLNDIINIKSLHNSENCYVCANGDLISGNIHFGIAVANRENVIKQVMGVSELISWFLSELSNHFKNVYFSSVAGNHSRLSNKDDSLKDERMDDLIPWYIKSRLQNINNVIVLENKIDNTMFAVDIRGKNYLNVHGDMDNVNSILKLVEMLPYKIYCIHMGHLHHNSSDFIQGYKVIMSGSLMGVDDYCIQKRIFGQPQQLVCVCDDTGIKAMYDCLFN